MTEEIKVHLGEPRVVVTSPPGEKRWGCYQFPGIYRLDGQRIAVSYSVEADSSISYGNPYPLCVSDDGGSTWQKADSRVGDIVTGYPANSGIVFPDGEEIKFPLQKPLDAVKLNLPQAFGRQTYPYGHKFDCYRLADLPEELQQIRMLRRKAGETAWAEEYARLNVPDHIVNVVRWEWDWKGWQDPNIFIQPRIALFFWTITPDGAVLVFQPFAMWHRDETLPERQRLESVVLCSEDRGRNWKLRGMAGCFADNAAVVCASRPYLEDPNSNYNRLWGGKGNTPVPNLTSNWLDEPGAVSFGNGRLVCVMRSNECGTHQPMFVSRSEDWGQTWTIPEILTPFGVLPRLILLDNGIVAMVYGRPGVQLLFCTDGKGERWHTPVNLLPEKSEKTPASVGRRKGDEDTCGNCSILKTGKDRFLVAYSDFRYRREDGQICKAIKVQEIEAIA